MANLKFKESIRAEVIGNDQVFLMTETGYFLLTGKIYAQLAPLLDGQHSIGSIMAILGKQIAQSHLFFALQQLQGKGYVVEVDESLPLAQRAFWQTLDLNVPKVAQRVNKTAVFLQTVGAANAEPLQTALADNGVQLADDGGYWVVLTDDYLRPELADINEQAQQQQRPWLLAKLVGSTIWLGPIFIPDETPCWECMAARIRMNRPVERFLEDHKKQEIGRHEGKLAALSATMQLGANMLATEVTRWIAQGENVPLNGRLQTLNTFTMERQTHHVLHRPQCPSCGEPARFSPHRAPQPISLQPAPKKFTVDGGHRTLAPEAAFTQYEHLISPITGVITHLYNTMVESDGLAYSFIAGHDFGATSRSINDLYQTLQGRSSGKGMTEAQAKMSAIGESIERYSAVFRGTHEITRHSTLEALGDAAIDPRNVWLFSDAQYQNRDAWNKIQRSSYHLVPRQFPTDKSFAWTPFYSLTNDTFKYYPTFSTYFNHPEFYQGYGPSHSNGCAAGHTLEEAIYQALLELIERDSIAIWWYNRLRYPRVDLDSFDIPYTQKLEAYYASLNRSLWVIDITADLGVPTFVAVSHRLDRDIEDIVVGMGSHLDPNIALLRSLSEVNQFLANVYYKNPDGSTRYLSSVQETIDWFKTATIENNQYLLPNPDLPARKRSDFSTLYGNDLVDDIDFVVERLRKVGIETFAVDLSQPDVPMKVCRVLAPGLRHFWRRQAPGRLYDVPLTLGRLAKPTPEEALNPVSMFF